MSIGPVIRAMLRNKLRFGLIAFEIALSFAIVVNSVTMIQRARAQMSEASGMADDEIVSATMSPFDPSFKEQAHVDQVVERDLAALRRAPGVRSATATRFLPWQGGGTSDELRPVGGRGGFLRIQQYDADESTFETLGLELVAGRGFGADDPRREMGLLRALSAGPREKNADGKVAKPQVQEIVISESFAHLAFGDEPALNKVLEDRDGDQYRVIGVIGTFYNPYPFNIGHEVLFHAMRPTTSRVRYLVRAEPGRKDEVARALEPLLLGVDPGRNFRIRSISELYTRYNAYNTLAVRVLSLVLFLVVFVTFLGVVGVTSFSVAERTRQIGIRRALGAQRGDVVRHFLLENAVVSGLGLGLGLALAYGLNVALVSRLGASRLEPATLVAAIAGLSLGGQLAALAPALRAARVAPTIATRNV